MPQKESDVNVDSLGLLCPFFPKPCSPQKSSRPVQRLLPPHSHCPIFLSPEPNDEAHAFCIGTAADALSIR
jgi:hypothetical protein